MRGLKFLIEKEFKQMFRNPLIPNLIVLFPLLMMLVFPWAISFEVKDLRVDIVDNSHSTYSRRLIYKIAASNYFILNDTPYDFNSSMKKMDDGKTDVIIEIPSTFDEDIVKSNSASLGISVNSVNGTQGLLGSNYITQVINMFSEELRNELIGTLPPETVSKMMNAPRIDIVPQYLFNSSLDYKNFMIPGFMVLVLTIICGLLPALNIVSEKEIGTINQINVTPVSKVAFILAKLIPYWVVGFIVMIICVISVYLIYGLWPSGGVLALIISSIVYILSISGMGIITSNYSSTTQQASFLVMFFILILILLGGMFSPISSMPKWAQAIALVNPLTYITDAFRLLYLNGSTLSDVAKDLYALILIQFVLNGWAVMSYKKRG